MAIETLLEEIKEDVSDVFKTGFTYYITSSVPNRSDSLLTFERNVEKKGKVLETCVLFVDIRNSVSLTQTHHNQTMGRIYTAFAKAVLKSAKYHSGHIRNILGDRIMIVFPEKDCFKNAVDCAITINHLSENIINKVFEKVDFKCGIGIDYGSLRVIKVGLQRQGHEATENRSLVWVGYPANIASRLTDVANKSWDETYFEVTRNPINSSHRFFPLNTLSSLFGNSKYNPNEPYYSSTVETLEMTTEEFANNIGSIQDGSLYMRGGKFIRFEKKKRKVSYPAILITEAVYKGYKDSNPERNDIRENYWMKQSHNIKNVSGEIYGSEIFWKTK